MPQNYVDKSNALDPARVGDVATLWACLVRLLSSGNVRATTAQGSVAGARWPSSLVPLPSLTGVAACLLAAWLVHWHGCCLHRAQQ